VPTKEGGEEKRNLPDHLFADRSGKKKKERKR